MVNTSSAFRGADSDACLTSRPAKCLRSPVSNRSSLKCEPVSWPLPEIVQALRSGAIDACEWLNPWLDMAMGLHQVASFYYYPAWQEPGTALALGINRRLWESLDEGDRRLIEIAAAGEYAVSLAEFNTKQFFVATQATSGGYRQYSKV